MSVPFLWRLLLFQENFSFTPFCKSIFHTFLDQEQSFTKSLRYTAEDLRGVGQHSPKGL